MLGKLFKYEFKATGRILPLIYVLMMAVAFLFGIIFRMDVYIGRVSLLIFIAASVALVLMTVIILIQRFYKNLLGNEWYLMMTLPVSAGSHVSCKIISAALWIVLGGLTGAVSVVLLLLGAEGGFLYLKDIEILEPFKMGFTGSQGTFCVIMTIVLLIIACAEMAAKIYAAIALGHQWSNHRALGAVLAYIGFSVIEAVVSSPLRFEFILDYGMNFGDYQQIIFTAIGLVAALLAVYWFVAWILVKKRLNLQ